MKEPAEGSTGLFPRVPPEPGVRCQGPHFWRQRPGWLHQLTPPSQVPADGWLHSGECSCGVCGPRTRLTA
jgi:hypothetical protein